MLLANQFSSLGHYTENYNALLEHLQFSEYCNVHDSLLHSYLETGKFKLRSSKEILNTKYYKIHFDTGQKQARMYYKMLSGFSKLQRNECEKKI